MPPYINANMEAFCIKRIGTTIGDEIHAAMVARALRNAGFDSWVYVKCNRLLKKDLVSKCQKEKEVFFNYAQHNGISPSLHEMGLKNIFKDLKVACPKIDLGNWKSIIDFNPSGLKKIDCCIVGVSGPASEIRNYPFFNQLKELFVSRKISFLDATNLRDFDFLRAVTESRVYIGLETGATMLAAEFLNKQNSLIIQSGYTKKEFWGKYIDVDFVERDIDCAPCLLRHLSSCKHNHKCMRTILPNEILNMIESKL
jgi:hypothetical protein